LLLFLIRRAEVDVTDIPIHTITDQYLSYLRGLETSAGGRIDIDLAGEFLVMAATLMEIKSRMLTPVGGDTQKNEGESITAGSENRRTQDPRADLVRQLLAYKQYRDASAALEHRMDDWHRRFPSRPAGIDEESVRAAMPKADEVELEDLELIDLIDAFSKIIESVNFDRLGEHHVAYDDTPIELHARDMLDRLTRETGGPEGKELPLRSIFTGRTRPEMIGLFMAMLELVRQRAIRIRQDGERGEILVRVREAEENAAPAAVADGGAVTA
jgi:segregation and condensation protein A